VTLSRRYLRLDVRDANGHRLWSGEMYAQYAKHGSGSLYYQKPAILERPSGTNDWVDVK
jgi:hypothetical protein